MQKPYIPLARPLHSNEPISASEVGVGVVWSAPMGMRSGLGLGLVIGLFRSGTPGTFGIAGMAGMWGTEGALTSRGSTGVEGILGKRGMAGIRPEGAGAEKSRALADEWVISGMLDTCCSSEAEGSSDGVVPRRRGTGVGDLGCSKFEPSSDMVHFWAQFPFAENPLEHMLLVLAYEQTTNGWARGHVCNPPIDCPRRQR
mmetsp:Transcript_33040/g.53593  ORF Transcript_33040/g.53593 Transcript_33040/m.53593 type:complete len:200 (+) Transcript_33040:510-1109(+)